MLGVLVGEHHHRVADADLGVTEAVAGPGHAKHLLRSEGLLQEVDEVRGSIDHVVGRERPISLGDGLDGHRVAPLEPGSVWAALF